MIPADVEPSLCSGEPTLDSLEDGFAPPAATPADGPGADAAGSPPAELALPPKSPF